MCYCQTCFFLLKMAMNVMLRVVQVLIVRCQVLKAQILQEIRLPGAPVTERLVFALSWMMLDEVL